MSPGPPSATNSMIKGVKFSVSDPNPDSIRSVDPYSDPESGSRWAKMTHKNIKKIGNLMF
jgi:hypothetical protein